MPLLSVTANVEMIELPDTSWATTYPHYQRPCKPHRDLAAKQQATTIKQLLRWVITFLRSVLLVLRCLRFAPISCSFCLAPVWLIIPSVIGFCLCLKNCRASVLRATLFTRKYSVLLFSCWGLLHPHFTSSTQFAISPAFTAF